MTRPIMNGERWFIVGLAVALVALCAGLWIAQQPRPRPTPTYYTPVIGTERDITGVNPCTLLTPEEGALMLQRPGRATVRNLRPEFCDIITDGMDVSIELVAAADEFRRSTRPYDRIAGNTALISDRAGLGGCGIFVNLSLGPPTIMAMTINTIEPTCEQLRPWAELAVSRIPPA